MAKCQTKCANDAKCVAFESNGKNCWYYGGVETQMPAPADHQGHQCYVKNLPPEDMFSTALTASGSWCRVPGNENYTGYDSHPETDMTKCRDKCLNDTKCKAFEADGKNCWYYSGQESPLAKAGVQNQCYVKYIPGLTSKTQALAFQNALGGLFKPLGTLK
jgi:hypothetical protein